MNIAWRISWILGVVVAIAFFIGTFIQFPPSNIFVLLGQLLGSLGIGAVVFLVTYGISALVVRITRKLK